MADEIKVTTRLSITKGYLSSSESVVNLLVSQTGDGISSGTQTIGTTAEAIGLGDLTTPGYAFFRNLDLTNFMQIGQDISGGGFEEFCRLGPGEVALFRIDLATGGVLQAKADTADCELQFSIYEN